MAKMEKKSDTGARRIIIAAGGTGGHFYPGFALAKHLKDKGWEVLFLVKENDMSLPRLREAGFPYVEVSLSSFPRTLNPFRQFKFFREFLKAVSFINSCVKDYMPNAVLGTGSYIGTTAVFSAWLKGVPSFIHESNSIPGLGNRIAMGMCKKVFLGIPFRNGPLSKKIVLTGTPVRETFANLPSKEFARNELKLKKDKFTILVFGGSQGADRLNMAVLSSFMVLKDKIQLIHITGRADYQRMLDNYKNHKLMDSPGFILSAYREDMPILYAAADLIISRSGASTFAELLQTEKPAILVPFPQAAGNHQFHNARELERAGTAVCVEETELFFKELEIVLESIVSGKKSVREMAAKYKEIRIPRGIESAAITAEEIEKAIAN